MDIGIWTSKALLGLAALGMIVGFSVDRASAQTVSHHAASPYVMLNEERSTPWLLQLQPGYASQQAHRRHYQRSASGRIVTRPTQTASHATTRAVASVPSAQTHQLNPIFLPQVVYYETSHAPGTIIVDPHNRFLYLVEPDGQARRYGVGVGRAGFGWSGTASVQRRAEWPTWTPPASMIERQPELEEWRHGMPGGVDNPLGARALYLYSGGRDTLYRIHGTNQPWTIGKAVSSGCIRMRNEDVTDLYERAKIGAKVIVM